MIVSSRIVHCIVAASACAALVAGCSTMSRLTSPEQRVFVSNYQDDTVSVIAGDPEREIKIIDVGDSPIGIAARPGGPLVAVVNSTGARVTFIDAARLEIVGRVEVGGVAEHAAFSSDGKLLFVTLPKVRRIAVIDPDTRVVRDSIALERKPKRLAVSPDGRRLYVLLHAREGGVAVVDIATHAVERIVPTGPFPTDFGLTSDGRRLVVASFDDDNVTVIDTVTLEPVATWPVPTGLGIVVHPTQPLVYSMDSFDGGVEVLNYATGERIATLMTGEFPTYSTITADGRFLYVVNEESDNVAKVDTATNERISRVGVGGEPANAVIVGVR